MITKLNVATVLRIRKLGIVFGREKDTKQFIVRMTTENGPSYAVVERKVLKNTIRLLSRKSFLEHAYGTYNACELVDRIVAQTLEDEMSTINKVLDGIFVYGREDIPKEIEHVLVQGKNECAGLRAL